MQGDYTSKGFVETLIKKIVENKIYHLFPNVEVYIQSEVAKCVNRVLVDTDVTKSFIKELILDTIVDNLSEKFQST